MARSTSKSRSRRPVPTAPAQSPAQLPGPAFEPALAMNAQASQWARDALEATLLQTQSLFTLLQALQQAQARALHDAAADIESAIESLRAAEDGSALAEVPRRFFNAQWQHSVENFGGTAGRLMEIESAWLAQAQAQAAKQMAAIAVASDGPAAPALAPPVKGNGADEAAQVWAQWVEGWQRGVDQMSRAWSDAVRAARPGA